LTGTSVAGLTGGELWPHTEGTAVERPPGILMLGCIRPAHSGGRSHLVDGREVYAEIARTNPAMLAALSAPHSACFGGGPCHLGPVFEQTLHGQVTVRLRFDELARFSPTLAPYLDRLRTLVLQRAIAIDPARGPRLHPAQRPMATRQNPIHRPPRNAAHHRRPAAPPRATERLPTSDGTVAGPASQLTGHTHPRDRRRDRPHARRRPDPVRRPARESARAAVVVADAASRETRPCAGHCIDAGTRLVRGRLVRTLPERSPDMSSDMSAGLDG